MPTREQVIDALEGVNDPHVPVSLRRMGMLHEIDIDGDGVVTVEVCIPCMACPGTAMIREGIRETVGTLDGVHEVKVIEGWHLPWSREMIEPEVRELMRLNGIQV